MESLRAQRECSATCSEGTREATRLSLESIVRLLASPQACAVALQQRSAVLAFSLSLIAVGIQIWNEEIVASRSLILLGLFSAPAALGRLPSPSQTTTTLDEREFSVQRAGHQELRQRSRAKPLEKAPKAMTMEPDPLPRAETV
eukprot:TRINITY_DN27018_c0_g1_i1.p1 TRINITY_DN27018_c0_g1~~TRINITY_DN27018_c0_g1_i1.p1  ORF type:complete len:144 (+),score=20.66 TRINITY_DN27018_c0_g1_i1:93-524(+)